LRLLHGYLRKSGGGSGLIEFATLRIVLSIRLPRLIRGLCDSNSSNRISSPDSDPRLR
jgi:hypothetical protein